MTNPAYRDGASANAGTVSNSNATMTLPATIQDGDWGALILSSNGNGPFTTPPSGWVLVANDSQNANCFAWVYVKRLTAADASAVIGGTGVLSVSGRWNLDMVCYSGCGGLDVVAAVSKVTASSATYSVGGVTPVQNDCLELAVVGGRGQTSGSTITWAAPAGWTLRKSSSTTNVSNNNVGAAISEKALTGQAATAQGSTTGAVTGTNVSASVEFTITVRPTLAVAAADTLSPADSATRTTAAPRAATDTLSPADSAVRATSSTRAAADTLSPADAAVRATTAARAAADTLAPADTASRAVASARGPADTLSPADAAARTTTTSRAAADTLSPADSATSAAVLVRSVSDVLSLTDAGTRTTTAARGAADSTPYADAVARNTAVGRNPADTLSPTDDAAVNLTTARQAADTLTLLDDAVRALAMVRTAEDVLALIDDAAVELINRRRLHLALAFGPDRFTTAAGPPRFATSTGPPRQFDLTMGG